MTYICKGCHKDKDESEFRIHKRGYRIGKCRGCEREYQRDWSKRNPELYRERKRISMAKRRREDPEGCRAYQLRKYHANRDANLSKMKAYQRRRFFWMRAMKLRNITPQQLASLWRKQRGHCAYSGQRLDRSAQVDHIMPRALGGTDDLSNLQWVCPEVNYAKRDLTHEQFIELCNSVMRWIGERIQMLEDL